MLDSTIDYGPHNLASEKGKSTTQAIHLLRRIMEIGERAGTKVNMVLLDWEKAFDKISHASLFTAMERQGIDPKLINLT